MMTKKIYWKGIIIGVAGVFYMLTGLGLIFLPRWFFTYIGDFPPFNRHYMGDAGAFILPLGVGMLFAARRPQAHRGVVLVTAGASLLHALNHAYDDWLLGSPIGHWFGETIPLVLFAGLLLYVCWRLGD
jgi:predicted anti-sigma-YlaC factor YlaD